MSNIALITFHAADNYGSVLQAYATVKEIENNGAECHLINYRFEEQEKEYSLYTKPKTAKGMAIQTYLRLFHFQRSKRKHRFDQFRRDFLNITKPVWSIEEIQELLRQYSCDICLSGGDQIWNKYVSEVSRYEDCLHAYFWDFEVNAVRTSYGTSVGNMKKEDLISWASALNRYAYIATRESNGVEMIEEVAPGVNVEETLDPVFLLDKEEWMQIASENCVVSGKYILLYSLSIPSKVKLWYGYLTEIAKRYGYKVVSIVPEYPYPYKGVEMIVNAGPREFLNLYANAEFVIADTYHALCFSIVFRKSFYVLGNKYLTSDIRKDALLRKFGLTDRKIENEEDIVKRGFEQIDYSDYEDVISEHIQKAKTSLKKSINIQLENDQ